MREIFTEIFENQPLDPVEAARRSVRPNLRKRFYARAHTGEGEERAVPVMLDGKPVMTPARRVLAAPTLALAEAIAAEWDAQSDVIDPVRMPLTRLANIIIDAVSAAPKPVADEVANYLASDLLFYRADAPAGLAAMQAQAWDPVLAWVRERLGARFALVAGVVHVAQPRESVALVRAAIPLEPWRLGAVASITTLTGSGLLALAIAYDAFNADAVWSAAHVDEDWQMARWGRDEPAMERRASREAEFRAAVTVLRETR